MTLLLVYATVSIFFSFLCSILEAVLLSVTSTHINLKKKEGYRYALILEELKKDVDKPLIAILTLNTIAHTVGAILVGVQAEDLSSENLTAAEWNDVLDADSILIESLVSLGYDFG